MTALPDAVAGGTDEVAARAVAPMLALPLAAGAGNDELADTAAGLAVSPVDTDAAG